MGIKKELRNKLIALSDTDNLAFASDSTVDVDLAWTMSAFISRTNNAPAGFAMNKETQQRGFLVMANGAALVDRVASSAVSLSRQALRVPSISKASLTFVSDGDAGHTKARAAYVRHETKRKYVGTMADAVENDDLRLGIQHARRVAGLVLAKAMHADGSGVTAIKATGEADTLLVERYREAEQRGDTRAVLSTDGDLLAGGALCIGQSPTPATALEVPLSFVSLAVKLVENDMCSTGVSSGDIHRLSTRLGSIGSLRRLNEELGALHDGTLSEEQLALLEEDIIFMCATASEFSSRLDWIVPDSCKVEVQGLADELERVWTEEMKKTRPMNSTVAAACLCVVTIVLDGYLSDGLWEKTVLFKQAKSLLDSLQKEVLPQTSPKAAGVGIQRSVAVFIATHAANGARIHADSVEALLLSVKELRRFDFRALAAHERARLAPRHRATSPPKGAVVVDPEIVHVPEEHVEAVAQSILMSAEEENEYYRRRRRRGQKRRAAKRRRMESAAATPTSEEDDDDDDDRADMRRRYLAGCADTRKALSWLARHREMRARDPALPVCAAEAAVRRLFEDNSESQRTRLMSLLTPHVHEFERLADESELEWRQRLRDRPREQSTELNTRSMRSYTPLQALQDRKAGGGLEKCKDGALRPGAAAAAAPHFAVQDCMAWGYNLSDMAAVLLDSAAGVRIKSLEYTLRGHFGEKPVLQLREAFTDEMRRLRGLTDEEQELLLGLADSMLAARLESTPYPTLFQFPRLLCLLRRERARIRRSLPGDWTPESGAGTAAAPAAAPAEVAASGAPSSSNEDDTVEDQELAALGAAAVASRRAEVRATEAEENLADGMPDEETAPVAAAAAAASGPPALPRPRSMVTRKLKTKPTEAQAQLLRGVAQQELQAYNFTRTVACAELLDSVGLPCFPSDADVEDDFRVQLSDVGPEDVRDLQCHISFARLVAFAGGFARLFRLPPRCTSVRDAHGQLRPLDDVLGVPHVAPVHVASDRLVLFEEPEQQQPHAFGDLVLVEEAQKSSVVYFGRYRKSLPGGDIEWQPVVDFAEALEGATVPEQARKRNAVQFFTSTANAVHGIGLEARRNKSAAATERLTGPAPEIAVLERLKHVQTQCVLHAREAPGSIHAAGQAASALASLQITCARIEKLRSGSVKQLSNAGTRKSTCVRAVSNLVTVLQLLLRGVQRKSSIRESNKLCAVPFIVGREVRVGRVYADVPGNSIAFEDWGATIARSKRLYVDLGLLPWNAPGAQMANALLLTARAGGAHEKRELKMLKQGSRGNNVGGTAGPTRIRMRFLVKVHDGGRIDLHVVIPKYEAPPRAPRVIPEQPGEVSDWFKPAYVDPNLGSMAVETGSYLAYTTLALKEKTNRLEARARALDACAERLRNALTAASEQLGRRSFERQAVESGKHDKNWLACADVMESSAEDLQERVLAAGSRKVLKAIATRVKLSKATRRRIRNRREHGYMATARFMAADPATAVCFLPKLADCHGSKGKSIRSLSHQLAPLSQDAHVRAAFKQAGKVCLEPHEYLTSACSPQPSAVIGGAPIYSVASPGSEKWQTDPVTGRVFHRDQPWQLRVAMSRSDADWALFYAVRQLLHFEERQEPHGTQ